MPDNWEGVDNEGSARTYRLRVPGGWLYRYDEMTGPNWRTAAMCFVPDPLYIDGGN